MKRKSFNLTWRTRRRLKNLGIILGTGLVLAAAAWLCWILWLGRFVVYSRDAVRLDFDWQTPGDFVTAVEPEKPVINIVYDDGSATVVQDNQPLAQMNGCIVTAQMLIDDLAGVEELIREQPKGTAVMLELKAGSGTFYYETQMPQASVSGRIDKEAMKSLLSYLAKADYYTIAQIPAFRDRAYGLENTSSGILHSSGGYLWAGSDNCYWLDPAKSGPRSYLISIATELRDLGFNEVVFTDFCFPPTEDILYEGDKLAVLNDTAQHLVYNLATEDFCVSFLCNEEGFVLPEGRTRLYRDGVDASMAQSVAQTVSVPDAQINLVYLTEANDTRFDAFSVLRPLPMGATQPLPTEPTSQEPDEGPVEGPVEGPAPVPEDVPEQQ